MPEETSKELFSPRDIGAIFNVSSSCVQSWIYDKKLRAFRVGGNVRVFGSEILSFFRQNNNGNVTDNDIEMLEGRMSDILATRGKKKEGKGGADQAGRGAVAGDGDEG